MKRVLIITFLALFLLFGCKNNTPQVQIVATTAPVYEFTSAICEGTNISIAQLITEEVSCLHNYTLQAEQVYLLESADLVIVSGLGLEDFLMDTLESSKNIADASKGITPLCVEEHEHSHDGHDHGFDPHIWLSPQNAAKMAENIYAALIANYPEYNDTFQRNYLKLSEQFTALSKYADNSLSTLSCRDLITFHDGFSYMAQSFQLNILHAIEEESGSEASASELISICELIADNKIPSIFTEKNGSVSSAEIIANETGIKVFSLDMAMAEGNYFDAMYHNIDILKEALE